VNSVLLRGDAAAVRPEAEHRPHRARQRGAGADAGRRRLVDEYLLLIVPRLLGQGRRLLDAGCPAALRLTECVLTTGVLITRYHVAT
jgi:hypothetical protein